MYPSWSSVTVESESLFIQYFSSKTAPCLDEDDIDGHPLVRRVDVVSTVLVLKMQDGLVVDANEEDVPGILDTILTLL